MQLDSSNYDGVIMSDYPQAEASSVEVPAEFEQFARGHIQAANIWHFWNAQRTAWRLNAMRNVKALGFTVKQ